MKSTLKIEQRTNAHAKSLNCLLFNIGPFFSIRASNLLSINFVNFFASAGSVSNMVVLISLHRSDLLLYCLLPSYDFVFAIEHRFPIRFRSGLDGGHSIIFLPLNLLCSKNSQISLDIWEGVLLCINTQFTLKLQDWDLYHAKKV